ncbi:MAG: MFS transporter [Nocardioides sp.]
MADLSEQAPSADEGPVPRGMLRETRDSLGSVFANPNLRRIELAFAGSAIGDWAYGTAVAVWAYGVGGTKAVGIWMAIRFTLMAISAPFAAGLADKMPRLRLMVLCDLVRAILVTSAAVCLFLDTPSAPIFIIATVTGLLGTPFMVAQRSLLPSLADKPEELTAANGTASTIESLAFFAGPALGALLLGFTTVQIVFLLNVATFLWSMALVLRIRPSESQPLAETEVAQDSNSDDEAGGEGFWAETAAGFRTIGSDRGLTVVTLAACVQTIVAGATTVFLLVMADDILGTGPRGVGFLDSVFGIGAILGGVYAISRASRGRLGGDLAVGVLLWSAPLLLVAVWPHPIACFAAMALLGLGNPLVDVNLDTIVQRLTPDEVLGRVFGALEACFIATMALGALVMPFLIDGIGLRWALFVLAVVVAVVALAGLPEMRRLDVRLSQPARLPLLQAIDIFAPMPRAAVEGLARNLSEVSFVAGDVIVREGDESDLFYVIESGRVGVTQGGRVLREEGAGDYFGEIGLLRDVPRTATITALEDTRVVVLTRDDFLLAVSGHGEARRTAESTVKRRLAA